MWGRIGHWLSLILTFGLALLWAIPVLWALVASFRPPEDPIGRGDVWFSDTVTLENYDRALTLAPFGDYYQTTILVVVMVLAVQFVTLTLAAFAFAHYRFRGRSVLFFFVLLQMMIPATALLVPNFSTIRELGLFDNRLALAIIYFGSAFGTFLMRQAFLEVPRDLVDAGIIDGCRWWQLLRHIYLPPAWPTLIAFGISSAAWHWNELLWPLVVTISTESRPLTFGLLRFTQLSEIGAQWSLLSAATLIVAAPLFVAFLIFQRRFIQSFLHSGIK
ncbi:MAG: carbohydrate ABC transporter permease [Anaerolineae bacterium]|nr:carbohydrate ABC transporter permease [Anaerolineae bacterium]